MNLLDLVLVFSVQRVNCYKHAIKRDFSISFLIVLWSSCALITFSEFSFGYGYVSLLAEEMHVLSTMIWGRKGALYWIQ